MKLSSPVSLLKCTNGQNSCFVSPRDLSSVWSVRLSNTKRRGPAAEHHREQWRLTHLHSVIEIRANFLRTALLALFQLLIGFVTNSILWANLNLPAHPNWAHRTKVRLFLNEITAQKAPCNPLFSRLLSHAAASPFKRSSVLNANPNLSKKEDNRTPQMSTDC